MRGISGLGGGERLELLCIGAHSDDIEIGCAGTILHLLGQHPDSRVTWVVGTAEDERRSEAERSAAALLEEAGDIEIRIGTFRDGHFPWQGSAIKDFLEDVARDLRPDVVLTHRRTDRHQDHRTLSDLTWTVFRDHLILEYEIIKFDGDLGAPNLYVPLSEDLARTKVDHLLRHFPSQRGRDWFSAETFEALMRIRAVESRAPSGFAEAFYARKVVL